ncbi:MAG: glycoside hydrolase family 130 protein [Holophaga sp.]|nr:glycoside hydrolase family 130 protein [Holophaga sp.]
MAVTVNRIGPILKPNAARVLARPFGPASEARAERILARVMSLSDQQVESCLAETLATFQGRHHHLERACLLRFEALRRHLFIDEPLLEPRRMLIGAYFTQEYSVESAALFNPSMVWHPDQTGLADGARRFILSLRSVGEGHLSSITFRSGILDAEGRIAMDPVSKFVTAPRVLEDPFYDKLLFERKLREMGHCDGFASEVLAELADLFTMTELRESIRSTRSAHRGRRNPEPNLERHAILTLAESNYEVFFDPASPLSERIIFPHSPSEVNGIEDARWVELREEDGGSHYTATYTAYDGRVTLPQLISTHDFLTFKITTLNGPQVQDKGMALFPRRIRGHYAMLSRQDGENVYLMLSDALAFWYTREIVIKPRFPWEFVQVGNCGSPIETPAGWLVLSHGVGALRRYTLGAFLLDLEDPTRVLGRLREPLLMPDGNEREGYVPNVVYSCGSQVHAGRLIIPYAMSDWASGFASVDLGELLDELTGTTG